MTDENMQGPDAEGVDWSGMTPPEGDAGEPMAYTPDFPSYPERADNPHNHRFTISIAPDKPPFLVIRGNTASEITEAFNELEMGGVYANCAAAWASLKSQGQLGAGLGPVTPVGPPAAPPAGAVPPQQQYPSGPAAPSPNQGPPPAWAAPPTPGYQQGPPQGGGWGGQHSSGPQEKPRPAGWAMVDVPFNDKDRFKALRAQGTETGNYLRGKIQWGGKGVYWLDPTVAAWVAQQGFPVQA
jgi:hypothetical protein